MISLVDHVLAKSEHTCHLARSKGSRGKGPNRIRRDARRLAAFNRKKRLEKLMERRK